MSSTFSWVRNPIFWWNGRNLQRGLCLFATSIAGLKDDEGKTPRVLPSSLRLEKATDAERQLPSGAQGLFSGSPELSSDWRGFHPTRSGSSGSRPDSGEESSGFREL